MLLLLITADFWCDIQIFFRHHIPRYLRCLVAPWFSLVAPRHFLTPVIDFGHLLQYSWFYSLDLQVLSSFHLLLLLHIYTWIFYWIIDFHGIINLCCFSPSD